MGKLVIKRNGFPPQTVELKPGSNRFGRNADNDYPIPDGSVSGMHCEMIFAEGNVFVRDFGSTNGTFLDRQPVRETFFTPGQILHLGGVEIVFATDAPSAAVAQPAAKPGLRVATVEHSPFSAAGAAQPAPTASPAPASGLRVAAVDPAHASPPPPSAAYDPHRTYHPTQPRVYQTFFQRLPSVFGYPFKGNGPIILILGALFFLLLDVMRSFHFPVYGLFVRLAVRGTAAGYLAAIMQRIVTHSAQGDDDMPGFPEVSANELRHPAFLLIGSFAVSFAPFICFLIWGDIDPGLKLIVSIALGALGCFYLPMAIIATSMYESIFALNPLLIIPSIVKIPLEYLVACVLLGLLLGVRMVSGLVLDLIPIPILPTVIMAFISLYLLTIEMRVLGIMYHSKSDELNWSF